MPDAISPAVNVLHGVIPGPHATGVLNINYRDSDMSALLRATLAVEVGHGLSQAAVASG